MANIKFDLTLSKSGYIYIMDKTFNQVLIVIDSDSRDGGLYFWRMSSSPSSYDIEKNMLRIIGVDLI